MLALEQQQVQEQSSQQAQTQDSAQNQRNEDNTEDQEAAMKSFTQTPVLPSTAFDSSDAKTPKKSECYRFASNIKVREN